MLDVNDYKVLDCGSDIRRMYEFNGTTPRGEKLVVEVSECYPSGEKWGKNDLPTLWYKHGHTKKKLPNYICIKTYVYDKDGQCRGIYNPQSMLCWYSKRIVLNYDWVLPVTKENINRLLVECVRRANEGVLY